MSVFQSGSTIRLTSTTSSQTVTVPAGFPSITIYNGAANPVYLAFEASVAVPTLGVWADQVICVQPGTTQVFDNHDAGGTLAYIASTAGGELVISIGDGA